MCDLASNFDLLGNEPCNKIVKSVVGGLSRYENLTEAGLFCKLLANINRNSCTDKAYRLSLGHIADVYGVINKYGKKGGDLQRALLNEAPPDVLLDSVSILKFLLTYQRNERDLLKVISLTLNVNNLKTNEFRNIVIIALEKLSDALRNELNANEFASDAVNICTTMDNFKDYEAVQKAAINAVSALSKHDKQNITQAVICKVVEALVKFETSEDIQKAGFCVLSECSCFGEIVTTESIIETAIKAMKNFSQNEIIKGASVRVLNIAAKKLSFTRMSTCTLETMLGLVETFGRPMYDTLLPVLSTKIELNLAEAQQLHDVLFQTLSVMEKDWAKPAAIQKSLLGLLNAVLVTFEGNIDLKLAPPVYHTAGKPLCKLR